MLLQLKRQNRKLCVLRRAHGRTKPEAMSWLCGFLPLWVEPAKLACSFLQKILEIVSGSLERAALHHYTDPWIVC